MSNAVAPAGSADSTARNSAAMPGTDKIVFRLGWHAGCADTVAISIRI